MAAYQSSGRFEAMHPPQEQKQTNKWAFLVNMVLLNPVMISTVYSSEQNQTLYWCPDWKLA